MNRHKITNIAHVEVQENFLELNLEYDFIRSIPDGKPFVTAEIEDFINFFIKEANLKIGERTITITNRYGEDNDAVIIRQYFSPDLTFEEAEDLIEKFGLFG
jgi:hypothetical protein